MCVWRINKTRVKSKLIGKHSVYFDLKSAILQKNYNDDM